MLVDSHCHLEFPDFADELDAVISRAGAAGIEIMLTIGTRVKKAGLPIEIANKYQNVFCSVGTHPHNAEEEQEISAAHLIKLSRHEKVVAIGETGLDFHYDHSPREIQEKSFRTHIEAARQTGLPLVIHTRNADEKMAEILRDEMGKGTFGGVLHCFSSGRELADTALELGLYISFSGILTFKAAEELRAIAADIPLDRILVETDAPYLAPVPKRGKRNEPAYTAYTAQMLADLRGLTIEEIAIHTTDNFFRLFTRARPQ